MGYNDRHNLFASDWYDNSYDYQLTCRCGAVLIVHEDDGVPGCRDIEHAYCPICLAEVARYYGTCDVIGIDDSNVSQSIKNIREWYDTELRKYRDRHGKFDAIGYKKLRDEYIEKINNRLSSRH